MHPHSIGNKPTSPPPKRPPHGKDEGPAAQKPQPPVAYSYVRFSTPDQSKGDSLRRQTEAAESFCKRRGWTLDRSLSLRDLGVSAFRGANALVGNLGVFLDAVKRGAVAPGSALIVESVDRISRQGIDEGYDLCKRILKAGIHIVTLSPERDFGPDAIKSLSRGALELQLILERAAEESERKSERVGGAWKEKKRKARENGTVLTHCLPAWVEEKGGKLVLIPDRAAVVKRIFNLASAGYGSKLTASLLISEGVRAFGAAGHWNGSYIRAILHDRRAVGEFQPKRKRGREKDGPPIPGYFPAAVTEEEWSVARAGVIQRRKKRGRVSKQVNIFAGLLKNIRDGGTYYCRATHPPNDQGVKQRVLINTAATEGRAKCYTFPFLTFEAAILSCLREIDPHDILPADDRPDETAVLGDQLACVLAELADATAFMEANGFSPTIGKRVTDLEVRQADLTAKLAAAWQEAAHPLSQKWSEAKTLMNVLDAAPDPTDARVRLQSVLRRIVELVVLLVIPRGHDRLCVAQIHFNGGGRRDYIIWHRPPKSNGKARVEGQWRVVSWRAEPFEWIGLPQPNLLDGDEPEDMERFLLGFTPDELEHVIFSRCEPHAIP